VVFAARRGRNKKENARPGAPRHANLFSVSAKARARSAKRAHYIHASRRVSPGHVSDRDAISIWIFAEGAPRRTRRRSAGLSVGRADARFLRDFTSAAGRARESQQRWWSRFIRAARLRSDRQCAARALEGVGALRFADGARIHPRRRLP